MLSYYGEFEVGGQKYKTLFDTGSNDLLLIDEKCQEIDCI